MTTFNGRFWLDKNGSSFLGGGRVELLKKIDKLGSINKASKEMKMSYKAAWDALNQMNETANEPLLERHTGGKGGGGATLTSFGKEQIEIFERFEQIFGQFIHRFQEAKTPEQLQLILNRTFLTTSARNQFLGTAQQVEQNDSVSEVTINLNNTLTITSKITTKSLQDMNIQKGDNLYAIIKSSDVAIATTAKKSETTNIFKGIVQSKKVGELSSEIEVQVGQTIFVGIVQNEEARSIEEMKEAYVCIKYDSVPIGI